MPITLAQELRNFISDYLSGDDRGRMLDDREGLNLQGAQIAWILSGDVNIEFLPSNGAAVDNTYSGALAGKVVEIGVTNAAGLVDPFNNGKTVVVTITGGTATGKLIDGVAGPVTLTLVDGKASMTISASGAGDVTLGLSGGTSGLVLTDTATVTLA